MKYTKEVLEKAVSKSFSVYGVMRELRGNTPPSGSLHCHLKKQIVKFGIDTSHFTGRSSNRGINHVGGNQKLEWSSVLVFHRRERKEVPSVLRRALIEFGREYICEDCKTVNWKGEPLTLEVHHKNNDNRDNRPENLSFLCPNCHSQIN